MPKSMLVTTRELCQPNGLCWPAGAVSGSSASQHRYSCAGWCREVGRVVGRQREGTLGRGVRGTSGMGGGKDWLKPSPPYPDLS